METQLNERQDVKEMTVLSLMLEYDRLQGRTRLSENDTARKGHIQTELAYRIEN